MHTRVLPMSAALILASITLAPACKPLPSDRNIPEQAAYHHATYHATVLKSAPGTTCAGPQGASEENRLLTLKVHKAFGAGALGKDTVILATAMESAGCGVDYAPGTEVILFAAKAQDCATTGEPQWTSAGSFNIPNPGKAQLDSLYQRPASLARPSRGGYILGKGLLIRPDEGACRVDGRALPPINP